jgi:excisionase family DNA binding protein
VPRAAHAPTADPPSTRLSLGPASRLLGVDPDTLRRWADDGRVEAFVTPGGHRRFDRREIERVAATRRPEAGHRPLASLGATPDRLLAAYRRSYGASSEPSARDAVPAEDHAAFRSDGRGLVASLVAYLDAPDDAARDEAEAAANALADDLARRLATAGLSLTESAGLFVAARRPFLAELGAIARRRAIDPARTSAMFEAASALLDRLLLRFIGVHQSPAA